MILGLSGDAGAGKDTFGYLLRDEYGYTKAAYADRLREALYTLNPLIDIEYYVHDDTFLVRGTDKPVFVKDVIDAFGWEGYKETGYAGEIRRLIQLLGTEVGRGIAGPNVWVDATFRGLAIDYNIVITDVRFPNEAQAIKDRGGYTVKIVRPGAENRAPAHASETSMNDWNFDFTITNNAKSIDEYREHIRAFMKYLPEHDYFDKVIGHGN